jgi:hypothetical protein
MKRLAVLPGTRYCDAHHMLSALTVGFGREFEINHSTNKGFGSGASPRSCTAVSVHTLSIISEVSCDADHMRL